MKILLVSANTFNNPDCVYPIGASYIATACRDAGHEVSTFDCMHHQKESPAHLARTIRREKPDLIVFSLRNIDDVQFPSVTSYMDDYRALAETCREESSAPLVLGGTAFSLFPEEMLDRLGADYGISGDGEEAIQELLAILDSGTAPDEKIFSSPCKAFSSEACIPERDFFDLEYYYKHGGLINIQTKRGCAHACSYCSYPQIEGTRVRYRKPEHVVDEIEFLQREKGIDYFFFVDSVFNQPESHVRDICRDILKRKLKIAWSAYFRPVISDPELPELMKASGCRSLELGGDSFSTTTLNSLGKNLRTETIFDCCERLDTADIMYAHSLIFGAPGETEETIRETVRNTSSTKATAIIAFLGIRLFREAPLAQQLVTSGYLSSIQDIGLEPLFYIEKGCYDFMLDFLKTTIKEDRRWIIPSLEEYDTETIKKYRFKNRKGMSWELKRFVSFLG